MVKTGIPHAYARSAIEIVISRAYMTDGSQELQLPMHPGMSDGSSQKLQLPMHTGMRDGSSQKLQLPMHMTDGL